MSETTLHFFDYFFLIFHTTFTLFNIAGWIFKRTRRIHLITVGLTGFSWFFLGIWYGWGYCFCTHWHWQVRQMLHNPITSYSYIHFLIIEITGINLPPLLVDKVVLLVFLFCTGMTIYLNWKDYRLKRITTD